MVVTVRRDGVIRRMAGVDFKEYLVGRYGVQKATKLYGFQQMLALRGAAEAQRILGPEHYVEVLVMLREAGLDV